MIFPTSQKNGGICDRSQEGYMLIHSTNFPTYPWNIPQTFNQHFYEGILSIWGWKGYAWGMRNRGMLGVLLDTHKYLELLNWPNSPNSSIGDCFASSTRFVSFDYETCRFMVTPLKFHGHPQNEGLLFKQKLSPASNCGVFFGYPKKNYSLHFRQTNGIHHHNKSYMNQKTVVFILRLVTYHYLKNWVWDHYLWSNSIY